MSDTLLNPKVYLQRLDSEVAYSCNRLTGGVVNVTVRVVKKDQDVGKGRFPEHAKLILKHAPLYIAGGDDKAL